jgi:hypothetical protein
VFSPAASGIFAAPDPNRIFVASYGNGYLVDVRSPASCESVLTDICHVVPVADARVLVLADNETLFGIGRDGIIWEQDTIFADGFIDVTGVGVSVTVLVNRPGGTRVNIRLDASTGHLLEDESVV